MNITSIFSVKIMNHHFIFPNFLVKFCIILSLAVIEIEPVSGQEDNRTTAEVIFRIERTQRIVAPDTGSKVRSRLLDISPADGSFLAVDPPTFSHSANKPGITELEIRRTDGRTERHIFRGNHFKPHTVLGAGRHEWRHRTWVNQQPASGWSRWTGFEIQKHSIHDSSPLIDQLFRKAREAGRPRSLPAEMRADSSSAARVPTENQLILERLISEIRTRAAEFRGTNETLNHYKHQTRHDSHASPCNREFIWSLTNLLLDSSVVWAVARVPEARNLALNMLEVSLGLDTFGTTNIRANDLCNIRIAFHEAFAFDLLHDVLPPDLKTAVLENIELRTNDALNRFVLDRHRAFSNHRYNSHGFRNVAAISAIAALLAGELPIAEFWFAQSFPELGHIGNPWIGSDGGYANGMNYGMWDMVDLLAKLDVLRHSTGWDAYSMSQMKQLGLFAHYFFRPDVPGGVFGDGAEFFHPETVAPLSQMMFQRSGDPFWCRVSETWRPHRAKLQRSGTPGFDLGYEGLVTLPHGRTSSDCAAELPLAAVFEDAGYAAMGTDPGMGSVAVFFRTSPYGSGSHSHADQTGFVVFRHGKAVITSGGLYDQYGSPHHRDWTRQTAAHNAITFNGGQGQIPGRLGAGGLIDRFEHYGDVTIVRGSAEAAYDGRLREARRTLVYVAPSTLLVSDLVSSDTPLSYEWNLHSPFPMKSDGRSVTVNADTAPICVQQLDVPEGEHEISDDYPVKPLAAKYKKLPERWHFRHSNKAKHKTVRFLHLIDLECREVGVSARNGLGGRWLVDIERHQFMIDPEGNVHYTPPAAQHLRK